MPMQRSPVSGDGGGEPYRSARDVRAGRGNAPLPWGADFADAGDLGHMGNEARLGVWPDGLLLLGRLLQKAGV